MKTVYSLVLLACTHYTSLHALQMHTQDFSADSQQEMFGLLTAIKEYEDLEALCNKFPRCVDSTDAEGNTPLLLAVKQGQAQRAAIFCYYGAQTTHQNHQRESYHSLASLELQKEIASELLKLNEQRMQRQQALLNQQLFDAVALAKTDSKKARTQFQEALKAGAHPDAKDVEGTPIFSKAMQLNDFEDDYFFCSKLLQAGANLKATDAGGVSLLLQAIGVYRVDITMLLEHCGRTGEVLVPEDGIDSQS